jgi:hypothetical protein
MPLPGQAGQPTKLNPERQEKICELIQTSFSVHLELFRLRPKPRRGHSGT